MTLQVLIEVVQNQVSIEWRAVVNEEDAVQVVNFVGNDARAESFHGLLVLHAFEILKAQDNPLGAMDATTIRLFSSYGTSSRQRQAPFPHDLASALFAYFWIANRKDLVFVGDDRHTDEDTQLRSRDAGAVALKHRRLHALVQVGEVSVKLRNRLALFPC